jgi:2-keto-4-pentenoate hydratase/2-oxohepta-3-ene-1,7-dioic acid hydratase in catechol pathway
MADLFAGDSAALDALRVAADSSTSRIARDGQATDDVEYLAPVPRPGKVVAIGRNYRAHADEEDLLEVVELCRRSRQSHPLGSRPDGPGRL